MAADEAIARIVARLKMEPSRTWSVIITVFGDVVVPRGGSIWLGSLLEIFTAMGIGDAVVRTAMSRLTKDNWLERRKIKRNSYYRLSARGRSEFEMAMHRVYHASPATWDGVMRMALIKPRADRAPPRAALQAASWTPVTPDVWMSPNAAGLPRRNDLICFEAAIGADDRIALAKACWPIEALGESYDRFLETFSPLYAALPEIGKVEPRDVLIARILLVHEFRRIVLRDPMLSPELLPPDWPAERANNLCARLYHALVPASEAWLSEHARAEVGALPASTWDLGHRFRSAAPR